MAKTASAARGMGKERVSLHPPRWLFRARIVTAGGGPVDETARRLAGFYDARPARYERLRGLCRVHRVSLPALLAAIVTDQALVQDQWMRLWLEQVERRSPVWRALKLARVRADVEAYYRAHHAELDTETTRHLDALHDAVLRFVPVYDEMLGVRPRPAGRRSAQSSRTRIIERIHHVAGQHFPARANLHAVTAKVAVALYPELCEGQVTTESVRRLLARRSLRTKTRPRAQSVRA